MKNTRVNEQAILRENNMISREIKSSIHSSVDINSKAVSILCSCVPLPNISYSIQHSIMIRKQNWRDRGKFFFGKIRRSRAGR